MGHAKGRVTPRGEIWFPIVLLGPEEIITQGLVDTGFNEFLSIPASWCKSLGVTPFGFRDYELADGSTVTSQLVSVRVQFLGQTRRVTAVLAEANEVLIGTQFLRNQRLTIRFRHRSARLDLDR